MKIALVHPKYGVNRPPDFPVGLAYIATPLRERGHDIVPFLMDIDDDVTIRSISSEIKRQKIDIVGVGALVTRYKFIKELTNELKRENPDVPIVIGGKIVDSIPDLLEKNVPADILCFGEGEKTIVEIVDAIERGGGFEKIDGISYKRDGKFVRTNERKPIEDLDKIQNPAYDLFSPEKYKNSFPQSLTEKLLPGAKFPTPIKSSRGCPFVCTFCRRSFEPKFVRLRGVDTIIDELRYLKNEYGFDSAIFNDELTLISRKRALELAKAMKQSGLNMKWHCLSRVDFIDRELIRELLDGGCVSIGFGIESGSQLILDEMNKKVNVERAREVLRICKEEGMLVNCTYIIGMPSESKDTVWETINFIKETQAFGKLFYATAYPGTELWENAIKNNKIQDVERYLDNLNDALDYSVNLTALKDEELSFLHSMANKKIRIAELKYKLYNTPFSFVKIVLGKSYVVINKHGWKRGLWIIIDQIVSLFKRTPKAPLG